MLEISIVRARFFLTRPSCSGAFQKIGLSNPRAMQSRHPELANHVIPGARNLTLSPRMITKCDLEEACQVVSKAFMMLLVSRPATVCSFDEYCAYIKSLTRCQLKAKNLVTIAWNLLVEQLNLPEESRMPQATVCIRKTKTQSVCVEVWEKSFKATLAVLSSTVTAGQKITKRDAFQQAKGLIPEGQVLCDVWDSCWRSLPQEYKHIGRPPRVSQ
ncbi:hypothetical protein [Mailhella sp.]